MRRALILLALALAGCANPGIVAMSQDTYMLARTDHGGIFGNSSALKAGVIADANQFATDRGKVAVPVAARDEPLIPGVRFASFEYQFRLVDPSDQAARSASLTPMPTRVEVKTESKSSLDVKTTDLPLKRDTYAELLKLDDLRKRGIITDAEFEEQKRKLLAAN